MREQEIQLIWGRIETWLKHQAPEIYQRLPPGASEALIEQTETKMHVLFPDEVKALYRLHNGGFGVDIWGLCSLESMCHLWECSILENSSEDWEDLLQAFPGERYAHSPLTSPYYNSRICHQWSSLLSAKYLSLNRKAMNRILQSIRCGCLVRFLER